MEVVAFPPIDNQEAVPVKLVATPDEGVPRAHHCTTIVLDESGSVNVFSEVVGQENFVNPFPVPPLVEGRMPSTN